MRFLTLLAALFFLPVSNQVSMPDDPLAQAPVPKVYPEKVTLEIHEINLLTVTPLIQEMDKIKASGTVKEVWFKINGPGGDVQPGNDLIDAIEQLGPIKSVCVADHEAYSMDAYILEHCDVRMMTKRSLLLFHEALAQTTGNAHQLRKTASFLEKISNALAEDAARRMGMPIKAFKAKIYNTEWVLGWEEALQVNAIDAVLEDPKDFPPVDRVDPINPLQILLGG